MFTRKFSISRKASGFLAAGIAAMVIGGGAVGIVSANSNGGSGIATAATSRSATSGQRVPGGQGVQRSVWARRRRIIGDD